LGEKRGGGKMIYPSSSYRISPPVAQVRKGSKTERKKGERKTKTEEKGETAFRL